MLPPGLLTITEVWDANLESAIEDMRNALEITSFIAFDVEFPGALLKKRQFLFNHPQEAEWDYINNTLKHTQPIQFGFAFYGLDNEGQTQHINTWQVNFRFDEQKDVSNPESIKFLKEHGFDFNKFLEHGVQISDFQQLFVNAGILGSPKITWVFFHGNFDIAYLLKVCTNQWFNDVDSYLDTISKCLPFSIDVKVLIERYVIVESRGLQKLATELNVQICKMKNAAHHAGFDAQVTFSCYENICHRAYLPPEVFGQFLYLNIY